VNHLVKVKSLANSRQRRTVAISRSLSGSLSMNVVEKLLTESPDAQFVVHIQPYIRL
jgi:hypothetical protein